MSNNIAVFASGNGSNFQYLIDSEKEGRLNGNISLVISDKPKAYINERAKKENIPNFFFEPKSYTTKKDYELVIKDILEEYNIDLIVLAGYMRLIGETILTNYSNRIINLHPSLLPSFKGKDAIGQAYEYGVKVTGVTVHFVDSGMDTGPIILQKVIYIEEGETRETLEERIHELEHRLLLEAVNLYFSNNLIKQGRKIVLK